MRIKPNFPNLDSGFNTSFKSAQYIAPPQSDWLQEDETQMDYIKNKPEIIGQKTSDGGEIFNDYENNKALSEFSHAEGNKTVAGSRAFKIKDMHEFGDTGEGRFLLESVEGLAVGMRYTAVLTNNFDFVGVIDHIYETDTDYGPHIVVTGLPIGSGLTIKNTSYLLIPDRPDLGDIVIGEYAHAEGTETTAQAKAAHAEGNKTNAAGKYAHAEGHSTVAAYAAHAEGHTTEAIGEASHAEGKKSKATKLTAHAEGSGTSATAEAAHSEGRSTHAENTSAHAEGEGTTASGFAAHSEGQDATASGDQSHAEGYDTDATGTAAHAEGAENLSEGYAAHVEGHKNQAKGDMSHAGGFESIANSRGSFVHGSNLIAEHNDQAVFGQFNDPGAYEDLFIIGNGDDNEHRANAFVVHRDGTATIQHGPINSNDVADKEYVDAVADSTKSFAQGQVNNYKSEVNAKFALVDTNLATVRQSIADNATLAENTYVKKVTPSSGKRVYTVEANSDGTSSQGSKPFNHSYYSEGWSLVQRDGNGKILAKDPENEYDVTNKRYVDAEILELKTSSEEYTTSVAVGLENSIGSVNGYITAVSNEVNELKTKVTGIESAAEQRHEELQTDIDIVESIAKGANQTKVFDTKAQMDYYIKDLHSVYVGMTIPAGSTLIFSAGEADYLENSSLVLDLEINGETLVYSDSSYEEYFNYNRTFCRYYVEEEITVESIYWHMWRYNGQDSSGFSGQFRLSLYPSEIDLNKIPKSYVEEIINVGTNFYIRDVGVPDYWWDGAQAQELETQKVDLTEYATQDWVEDKGYLTEHQDISGKLDSDKFTQFTDKFNPPDGPTIGITPISHDISVWAEYNGGVISLSDFAWKMDDKIRNNSIKIGNTIFTEDQLIKILNFINKIEMTGGTN